MKQINLLPLSELKELKFELASKKLLEFFIFIILTFIILIVGAFFTKLLVTREISTNDQQISQLETQLNSSDNQALQKEILALNSEIKNIKTLGQQHYYWSKALVELANVTPSDLHVDLLTMDRATGQVTITGTADDRNSILTFWSNVKKSTLFQNINFPLNNLEVAKDTPFTFTFFVNPSLIQTQPSL